MKNVSMKLLSAILSLAIILTFVPGAFAAQTSELISKQIIHFDEWGFICERVETVTGDVTVYVKDAVTNEIQDVVRRVNGHLYLNDTPLAFNVRNLYPSYEYADFAAPMSSSSTVTWGSWSTWESVAIPVVGWTIAAIAGAVIRKAPWVGSFAGDIAELAIADGLNSLSMKVRIRYGSDDTYSYYERETKFYLGSKQIGSVYTDRGKWIVGAGVKSL